MDSRNVASDKLADGLRQANDEGRAAWLAKAEADYLPNDDEAKQMIKEIEAKQKTEANAKARALAYLNANRVKDGLAPLKRIEREYWRIYGKRWIEGETVQPRD